jgi:hypothetical protein
MRTIPAGAIALALTVAMGDSLAQTPPAPRIVVIDGSDSSGRATAAWLTMLRDRLSPTEYDSVKSLHHTRSPAEAAWKGLIESRAGQWSRGTDVVRAAFDPLDLNSVIIVVGDRGAEDAFAHDSQTIGFDLAALQQAYGDAMNPGNAERLDRIFRHELSHVLQKIAAGSHPFIPRSSLDEAVRREWTEGLGNYFSLSADWLPAADGPSATARGALAELQPVFASRMASLACARGRTADSLMKGLSSGPFAKKWGALPVALWLAEESRARPAALREFTRAGPDAVWRLADRHLPPNLADSVRAARRRSDAC